MVPPGDLLSREKPIKAELAQLIEENPFIIPEKYAGSHTLIEFRREGSEFSDFR